MGRPTLIVVSGPPGSGKTTLAHALAGALGCPALCRDEIKEGLVRSEASFVPAVADPLTTKAYAVFWATTRLLVEAEVTLVVEAAFQHRLWAPSLEPFHARAVVGVIRCHTSPALAAERIRRRQLEQPTRTAHADDAHLASAAEFDPIRIDAPTLEVDTSDGLIPPLAAIVAFCVALSRPGSPRSPDGV